MGMKLNPIQQAVLSLVSSGYDGTITVDALVDRLSDIKGARKCGLLTSTEPRMRKTGNPYIGVRKVSRTLVDLNLDYEGRVNTRREKEGETPDFKAGGNWHQPVFRPDGTMTPFAEHKTTKEKYVRAILDRVMDTRYVMPDGTEICPKDIEPFLQKSDNSNQGLADTVKFFTTKVDNVVGIIYAGETLLVA